MANIYSSIDQLVGKTPLVRLTNLEKQKGLHARILGKLEYFNPTGSVKDRIAKNMIEKAEEEGRIHPGDSLLDFTSGNTGISTAAIANVKGYKYTVVIQPGVSEERTQILKAYGAGILQSSAIPGFDEMLRTTGLVHSKLKPMMEKFAEEKGYYYLDQGNNPNNPQSHYETTAVEIWEDTDGDVDYIVALVGTGGTLYGISRFFRESKDDIRIIGVQPAPQSRKHPDHPEINTIDGVIAFHGVDNYPAFWNEDILPYDECIDVVAEDAYETGRSLVKSDGLFLGQSAAAAVEAAIQVARRPEAKGKTIAVILPDNGFKYLSTNIYKY